MGLRTEADPLKEKVGQMTQVKSQIHCFFYLEQYKFSGAIGVCAWK